MAVRVGNMSFELRGYHTLTLSLVTLVREREPEKGIAFGQLNANEGGGRLPGFARSGGEKKMVTVFNELGRYWLEGASQAAEGMMRTLRDRYPIDDEPQGATPFDIVHEGETLRLRHYRARGEAHRDAAGGGLRAGQAPVYPGPVAWAQRDRDADAPADLTCI